MKSRILPAVAALALLATTVFAGDAPAKRREDKDRVEIPATVACVACTLESWGADAQATLYSKHAQGLLLPDGTLWSIVDNAKGHGLVTNEKLKDKEIKVLGWKFAKAQYVEVSKYSLKDGDKWVAYDFCKNCGWEPGDNQGTDLCPDCREGK